MTAWRPTADALRRHGDRIALEGIAPSLTYLALAARAVGVADALDAAGVRPGQPVALVSKGRAHDEPVALAGIHLANAVAIPLDATSPPMRLASIMESRSCRAVVHDPTAAKLLRDGSNAPARIELDEEGHVLSSVGHAASDAEPTPDFACILHTSGSTGTPKAIPISWDGLDAFTSWMIDLTQLTADDRVLRVAELIFDLAWFDHLATWRSGAALCTMSRRQLAAGKSTLAQLETLRPTVMYGVPALWMKITQALGDRELDPSLRTICFAGEVFPPRELKALADHAPSARLFNLFGPTETNVCTFHEVDRQALDGESELPIGIACPYAECRLVSEDGVVDGPGMGELVVRGPTAMNGEVETRDRVERRDDGLFYFRGRIDRMVKIRGFRVDPSEVEAALTAHSGVREAAAAVRVHPRLGKTLCGYVALRDATGVDARALRKHCSERLAPYMVPDAIEIVDALPRTTTEKIDYQALGKSED